MLGYNTDTACALPQAWGHITCGGTVANIEAVWAARNLKFYPLAVKRALASEPALAAPPFAARRVAVAWREAEARAALKDATAAAARSCPQPAQR